MSVTRGPEVALNAIRSSAVGSPPSSTRAEPRRHLHPRVRTGHAAATPTPIHQLRSKRVMDVVGAVVALIVFSPIFLATAIAIYLTDRGPILFRQTRVGADGRLFEIIKFRSMCINAEDRLHADGDLHAQYLANNCKLPAHADSRLTRIGRFLRASSIDELPQFWNVLRGDMSLVGPRPVLPLELEDRYGDARFVYAAARPGITGPWQVSGRSRVPYDQRVRLDATYVQQWRLAHDFRILARTPVAVVTRDGAY